MIYSFSFSDHSGAEKFEENNVFPTGMTPLQIRIVDNDEIYIRILFYAILRNEFTCEQRKKVGKVRKVKDNVRSDRAATYQFFGNLPRQFQIKILSDTIAVS